MKNKNNSFYVGSMVGTTMLMLVLQVVLAAMPIGAMDLKMDNHVEKSNASFLGESDGDYAGYSVAMAGDVNGDGYEDMLIGAEYNDEMGQDAGQTYLIFGGADGWAIDSSLSEADASWQGEEKDSYSGFSVAGAGDVNGDGYDDILIGAPYSDEAGTDSGQVYLIFGKATGWLMDGTLGKADASFQGTGNYDLNGYSVGGVGDVNGDGYDDIMMGAIQNDDNGADAGRAYLFLGKADGWAMDTTVKNADSSFFGASDSDLAGINVAGVGDVNGDGYDDIMIGAAYTDYMVGDVGASYLFFGNVKAWSWDTNIKSAEVIFYGETSWGLAGYVAAGIGDVNGDGIDDLAVGAPYDNCDGTRNSCGQTYLKFGMESGWPTEYPLGNVDASLWGERDGSAAGYSISTAGDVNGDGLDDFLIGAAEDSESGSQTGQVYLVLGKSTGWMMDLDIRYEAFASWNGESDGAYTGVSVSGGGDVNGDGIPDILIGSIFKTGKTYLYLTYSAPPVPKGVVASNAVDGSKISINWKDPDTWNEKITAFRVYRSLDGTNYKHIGTAYPGDLSYGDLDVVVGRTYYYVIVSVDSTGALSDMSATASITCDVDTDQDGFGDMVDPDDDGDGIPDFSDAFPLDANEWIDTDMDGKGNVADTDDDNDGMLDNADAAPLNPLNGIQGDITYLNTTLKKVNTDVTKIKTDMISMNGNITSLIADIDAMDTSLTGMLTTVTADVAVIKSDVSGMNQTLQDQLVEIENDLWVVNGSIQNSIKDLKTNLQLFRTETATSLKEIKDMLGRHDKNLTKEISNLNKTINQLEQASLAQITGQLTVIEEMLEALGVNDTEIMNKIAEVRTDIGNFRTNTTSSLQNVNTQMTKLDTIQQSINDLKKAQKSTNSKVEAGGTNDMIVMVMLVLVMVLAIVGIVMSGKKK